MIKKFVAENVEYIWSKDEFGYQEVLDDMVVAKEIIIVTYNISDKHNKLIDYLKNANDECEINIVTNIPNRWDEYYKEYTKELANKRINIYLNKLNPEEFNAKVNVYFNFNNHSKAIMTDNIGYIGSANFSDESSMNIESGTIYRGKELFEFYKSNILPEFTDVSIPYYEYDYTYLAVKLNMELECLLINYRQLYDQIFDNVDCVYNKRTYYKTSEDSLDIKTIEDNVTSVLDSIEVKNEVYKAIKVITYYSDESSIEFKDLFDELTGLSNEIVAISRSSEVYELGKFSVDDFIIGKQQNEYLLIANEENLDDCIELATEDAMNKLFDLCVQAEDKLKNLILKTDKYIEKFTEVMNMFNKYDLIKNNNDIDNT
ncbi:MAG: phospholipase D-like domain-containing protein [Coprobacillaceae bacterium]